jgi:hypothetical protein
MADRKYNSGEIIEPSSERGKVRAASRDAAWNRWFALVIAFHLLIPHFFSYTESPNPERLGLARVNAGDEPHYLIILNSLLRDGDLELANNYDAAYQGLEHAGLRYCRWDLNHHSIWFEGDTIRHWSDFYEVSTRDKPMRLRAGVKDPRPHSELPWNVPGLPLLLAPLLYPFRATTYMEPVALLFSAAAAFGSFIFFRRILFKYLEEDWKVNALAYYTMLGTPLWHYGRALFPEGFLAMFLLGCFWAYLERRFLLAGVFLALAIFIKPPIGLVGLPLLAEMLFQRRIKSLIVFSIPLAVATGGYLTVNAVVYGGLFHSPSDIYFQWPFWSLLKQMFSYRGILPFAPLGLLAALGWPALWRQNRRESMLILSCFAMWYFFVACLENWDGGYSYGPRYMVPIIPFLMMGLIGYLRHASGPRMFAFFLVGALSMIINVLGAIPYWIYWQTYPPREVIHLFLK